MNKMLPYYARIKCKFIRSYYMKKKGLKKTVRTFSKIGGKKFMSCDEAHIQIQRLLDSNKPCMIGRFGSIELLVTIEEKIAYKRNIEQRNMELCRNAGFFPNKPMLIKKYSECMCEAASNADVQGVWYLCYEDYAVNKLLPQQAQIIEARYLEPWFCPQNPWTKALKGKKVLVIHPFTDTIKKQYEQREKLFPMHEEYLPDFELITMKAVQTQASAQDGRFENWFQALEYMHNETLKKDFDVALIGCGAYGYPLASMIKKDGKQAIHLGGVLQAMFGIKGKRWDNDSLTIVKDLYNDYWVRPSGNEVPENAQKIEGACYW